MISFAENENREMSKTLLTKYISFDPPASLGYCQTIFSRETFEILVGQHRMVERKGQDTP